MQKSSICTLDVFYIISAFLITELLLRERESNGVVDLRAFYTRRLLRIWPLYFSFLGLAWLTRFIHGAQPMGWVTLLAFLLFVGNWVVAVDVNLVRPLFIGPLWSVCFEEQFYLIWPLVLRRVSQKAVFIIAAGLLVVSNLTRLVLLLRHPHYFVALWCNTLVRADSIVCGIVLAVVLHERSLRLRLPARLGLITAGLAAWVVVGNACGMLDASPPLLGNMIGYPLMTLGAMAIFLGVLNVSEGSALGLHHPTLIYLGKISYGLYVFHWFSMWLVNRWMRIPLALGPILVFGVTTLFAAVSYQWLEKPFLRMKRKFTYVPSGANL